MIKLTLEQVEKIVETGVGESPEGMDEVKVIGRTMDSGIEIQGTVEIAVTTTIETGGETAEIWTSFWEPASQWGFEINNWEVEWK